MAHQQAGVYPFPITIKVLGVPVFFLAPGWDASPLQGYPSPPAYIIITVRAKCLPRFLYSPIHVHFMPHHVPFVTAVHVWRKNLYAYSSIWGCTEIFPSSLFCKASDRWRIGELGKFLVCVSRHLSYLSLFFCRVLRKLQLDCIDRETFQVSFLARTYKQRYTFNSVQF